MSESCKYHLSRRILWVEDDYYHLKGLVKPLEKMGFTVVPARSVVEARTLLKEWKKYCLVLLDLIIPYSEMPVPGAAEGTGEIRDLTSNGMALFEYMKDELGIDIPIVILSVVQKNEDADIDMLEAKGAVRPFVKRGVLPEELKNVVIRALEQANKNN